ncbi:MAG: flagellar hook-length control protein FliK, partial [Stellaceae bacterium]
DAGAATTADLGDRLSHQIVRLLANSDHSAVVRLHPPELGEVTVRVAIEGRDVTAWFGASQPLVQQTISQAIGQLHADLGSAGYNLSGAWVGADASGAGAGGGNVPLPPPPALSPATSFAPVGTVAAVPRGRSGVSIYV